MSRKPAAARTASQASRTTTSPSDAKGRIAPTRRTSTPPRASTKTSSVPEGSLPGRDRADNDGQNLPGTDRTGVAGGTGRRRQALIALVALLVGAAWGAALGGLSQAGLLLGAASGAFGGLLWFVRGVLTPRLGRKTALAATVLAGAVLLAAVAAIPSQCPDYVGDGGRCTVTDVAVFGFAGGAAVLMLWAFTLPLFAARRVWQFARRRAPLAALSRWAQSRSLRVGVAGVVLAVLAAVGAELTGLTPVRDATWLLLGVAALLRSIRIRMSRPPKEGR